MKPYRSLFLLILVLGAGLTGPGLHAQVVSTATAPYLNFESGPVKQLMLSPDGSELYLLNTIDHRLEIFQVSEVAGAPQLTPKASIFTGLEPVSMALHPANPDRLFVANLISDSVAVVDLVSQTVEAILNVGDEPRDVEVVGDQLFVACSRGRSANNLLTLLDHGLVIAEASPPYTHLKTLNVDGHKPRSLCTDGRYVYIVPQNSGNETTVLKDDHALLFLNVRPLTIDSFDTNFILNEALIATPDLNTAERGWRPPQTGRIVFDYEFPLWTPNLPDRDIMAYDTVQNKLEQSVTTGVGTTLFAIEHNPVSGDLWVANTDANNRIRMEYNLTGTAVRNLITVVNGQPGGSVKAQVELSPPVTATNHSQPHVIQFYQGSTGAKGYVATLGTASVIVFDATNGNFLSEIQTQNMPGGLAIDEQKDWLFVYSRDSKDIEAFDIANNHQSLGVVGGALYDPEPPIAAAGRLLLYDARPASGAGSGLVSCSSCHVFGDVDQLAWDLGNSQGGMSYSFPALHGQIGSGYENEIVASVDIPLHSPMKGPLVTQSLRGMKGTAPFHWRGDRPFMHNFQPAFESLNGGSGISSEEMQAFATFAQTILYAPNPYQSKDRQYRGEQARGMEVFGMPPHSGKDYVTGAPGFRCVSCHEADFNSGNYFGTHEFINEELIFQTFNPVTFRGIYEKQYKELTGFGTHHDGVFDGVFGFVEGDFFGFESNDLLSREEKLQLEDFIHAWDTGLAPLIGDQVHLPSSGNGLVNKFLNLAEDQAQAPKRWLDLIGKGWRLNASQQQEPFGMTYQFDFGTSSYRYLLDDGTYVTRATLQSWAQNGQAAIVFTAVPPETGLRLGIDQDEDGLYDGLELFTYGTRPDDPDTDDDGYGDFDELSLGGNPTVFDANLNDSVAPTVVRHESLEPFVSTITLEIETDEPTTLSIMATPQGGVAVGPFLSSDLRKTHQVILSGLQAGKNYTYDVTALDRNTNQGQVSGSFTTVVPHVHLELVEITRIQNNPTILEAKFKVVDREGNPVDGVPVHGRVGGDIGNQPNSFIVETNVNGEAVYTLQSFQVSTPHVVTLGVDFVGSQDPNHPFFVGYGGGTANFFYEQAANTMNYDTVNVF